MPQWSTDVTSAPRQYPAGFLLFIILTSNPFTRTLPNFPIDGRDLNPMLQDEIPMPQWSTDVTSAPRQYPAGPPSATQWQRQTPPG
jgi:hypothetical protein